MSCLFLSELTFDSSHRISQWSPETEWSSSMRNAFFFFLSRFCKWDDSSLDRQQNKLFVWLNHNSRRGRRESNRSYKYFTLSRTSCNYYWRCSLGSVKNRQQLISLSPTSHRQPLFVLLNHLSPRPHLNSKDVRTVEHLPNFLIILIDAFVPINYSLNSQSSLRNRREKKNQEWALNHIEREVTLDCIHIIILLLFSSFVFL